MTLPIHHFYTKLFDGGMYFYFYRNYAQMSMCGLKPDECCTVIVRECLPSEESDYWGFLEDDGEYHMIQPSWGQFNMQFPYGCKAAEEAGDGRRANLMVEEVE